VTIAEASTRCIIFSGKVQEAAGSYGGVAASFPFKPVLRSDAMFSLATDRRKSDEPRLAHPGQPADSDGAKQPPLPGTPYTPYSEKPAMPELPYKPYAEKPAHEAPYEPYKGI
jgi:hypothetical protein